MNNPIPQICQRCHTPFSIEAPDEVFYRSMQVPFPTFCPECRLQRRLIWRNEYNLYRRPCNAPGHSEEIISFISPDKPYTVYDQPYWWSVAWDAADYGREYDFSRPFFEQFGAYALIAGTISVYDGETLCGYGSAHASAIKQNISIRTRCVPIIFKPATRRTIPPWCTAKSVM